MIIDGHQHFWELLRGDYGWLTPKLKPLYQDRGPHDLAGLVTEANLNWSIADLSPYVDHLIEYFGPGRIIWGSDWPVCTLAASYDDWMSATTVLLEKLNDLDRASILGGNALTFYQLKG